MYLTNDQVNDVIVDSYIEKIKRDQRLDSLQIKIIKDSFRKDLSALDYKFPLFGVSERKQEEFRLILKKYETRAEVMEGL
jgi:hypothetical protein